MPPNVNSVKQLRFFKTTRPRKKAAQLPKPSYDQEKSSRQKLSTFQPKFCAICFDEDDRSISDEVEWVQCAKCAVWVHSLCVHLELEENETYLCTYCIE